MAEQKGFEVLSARPSSAETQLSFSGLADLLRPLPECAFEALPGVQREALDVALLRRIAESGTAPERSPRPCIPSQRIGKECASPDRCRGRAVVGHGKRGGTLVRNPPTRRPPGRGARVGSHEWIASRDFRAGSARRLAPRPAAGAADDGGTTRCDRAPDRALVSATGRGPDRGRVGRKSHVRGGDRARDRAHRRPSPGQSASAGGAASAAGEGAHLAPASLDTSTRFLLRHQCHARPSVLVDADALSAAEDEGIVTVGTDGRNHPSLTLFSPRQFTNRLLSRTDARRIASSPSRSPTSRSGHATSPSRPGADEGIADELDRAIEHASCAGSNGSGVRAGAARPGLTEDPRGRPRGRSNADAGFKPVGDRADAGSEKVARSGAGASA